jgi:inorganic pyrophosphatase
MSYDRQTDRHNLREQTEKEKTIRNDRLLAIPVTPVNPALFAHIDDLPHAC